VDNDTLLIPAKQSYTKELISVGREIKHHGFYSLEGYDSSTVRKCKILKELFLLFKLGITEIAQKSW
jgi:hypothetical protein